MSSANNFFEIKNIPLKHHLVTSMIHKITKKINIKKVHYKKKTTQRTFVVFNKTVRVLFLRCIFCVI